MLDINTKNHWQPMHVRVLCALSNMEVYTCTLRTVFGRWWLRRVSGWTTCVCVYTTLFWKMYHFINRWLLHSEKNEIEGVRILQIAQRKQRIIEKCNIFQIVYTCRVCYLLAMYLWSYTVWFSLVCSHRTNGANVFVFIFIYLWMWMRVPYLWKLATLLLYGQKYFMHKTSTQEKETERKFC